VYIHACLCEDRRRHLALRLMSLALSHGAHLLDTKPVYASPVGIGMVIIRGVGSGCRVGLGWVWRPRQSHANSDSCTSPAITGYNIKVPSDLLLKRPHFVLTHPSGGLRHQIMTGCGCFRGILRTLMPWWIPPASRLGWHGGIKMLKDSKMGLLFHLTI